MIIKMISGISKFTHKTGKAPDYIYLGANQWHQFKKEVTDIINNDTKETASDELYGISIIVVHSDNHLSFGIEANEY